MSDERYLQFPLFMLKGIFERRNSVLNNIVKFGVHKYAENMNITMQEAAEEHFNIGWNNYPQVIKDISEINKKIEPGEVMPMLNFSIIHDFLFEEKTEYELTQLLGFIAIRSILGQKTHALTNYNHVFARMCGFKRVTGLDFAEVPEPLFKYYKGDESDKKRQRYHFTKLLNDLKLKWHIKALSNPGMRGFYISTKLEIEVLAIMMTKDIENKKRPLQDLKEREKAALANAIEKAKKTGLKVKTG